VTPTLEDAYLVLMRPEVAPVAATEEHSNGNQTVPEELAGVPA
jgi:hypothetical protein